MQSCPRLRGFQEDSHGLVAGDGSEGSWVSLGTPGTCPGPQVTPVQAGCSEDGRSSRTQVRSCWSLRHTG